MSEEQNGYAENKDLAMITHQAQVSMFLNEQRFEFAQRIGKMIAASTMVPEHFRNNLGNCMIALNLAERLGLDVFGLMSTSYVVHGRPGFEAKLMIAIFNARTQLFIPPLRWEFKGDFPKGKDAAARAYAVDKETKEPLYGEWIDWQLVQAEGWDKKQGSKWLTMPGQMFRYRSASFFINAYEPGLKMGIMTVDEINDSIIDVTPEKVIPKIENGGKASYEIKTAPPEKAPTPDTTGGLTLQQETLLKEIRDARPKAGKNASDNYRSLLLGKIEILASLPVTSQNMARAKWDNADMGPWPLDPKEPTPVTVVTEPSVPERNGGGQLFEDELVECPKEQAGVGVSECEQCSDASRCQSFQEYRHEQA